MPPAASWHHAFGSFDLAAPRPAPPPGRPYGVTVVGNLASEKGVGESARAVVRGLAAAGVPHALVDFPDAGAANVDRTYAPTADPGYPVAVVSANPDTLLLFARRGGADLLRGRYVIGNWHWDLPEFPPAWAPAFDLVHEVWVGSTFTLDAVARAAPCPVVRVPPTLEPPAPAGELTRAALGLPPDAFVVLFVFDLASTVQRKNPAGLIRAFPREPDARLVLKFSRGDRYPGKAEMAAAAGGDGRVVLLDGVLPRGRVADLLALCDCYTSLHRSEGFGLTPAEALLLGKPAVATGYSGNLDYMTPWNSYPVRYDLIPVEPGAGPYPAGSTWAAPDEADAARQLRRVYEDRAGAAAAAAAGRAAVAAGFSPAAVGAVMAARVARVLGPPPAAGPVVRGVPEAAEEGGSFVVETDGPPGRLVGRWRGWDGRPLPDLPEAPVPVPGRAAVPVPDAVGDYLFELGPAASRVRVTGRAAGAIDYRELYARADLDANHWLVVGPATREEYDRLAGVKLGLLAGQGLTPASRLLDLGCGTGQLAQAAEPFLADAGAYHGTDVAPEAVAFCRRRFRRPNFTFSVNGPAAVGIGGTGAFDAAAAFSVARTRTPTPARPRGTGRRTRTRRCGPRRRPPRRSPRAAGGAGTRCSGPPPARSRRPSSPAGGRPARPAGRAGRPASGAGRSGEGWGRRRAGVPRPRGRRSGPGAGGPVRRPSAPGTGRGRRGCRTAARWPRPRPPRTGRPGGRPAAPPGPPSPGTSGRSARRRTARAGAARTRRPAPGGRRGRPRAGRAG